MLTLLLFTVVNKTPRTVADTQYQHHYLLNEIMHGINIKTMQGRQVLSLGQEDPLEKEIASHSSILAWEIPCTDEPEPGRVQSMELQSMCKRVQHNSATKQQQQNIQYVYSNTIYIH